MKEKKVNAKNGGSVNNNRKDYDKLCKYKSLRKLFIQSSNCTSKTVVAVACLQTPDLSSLKRFKFGSCI